MAVAAGYVGAHFHIGHIPILPHAEFTGFMAQRGSTVDLSGVNLQIMQQQLTVMWRVRTYLAGVWCTDHNTMWGARQHFAGPQQQARLQQRQQQQLNRNHVLRGRLEPSNGVCHCHGVSGGIWPLPHQHSILMCTPEGQLAGHVYREVAEAFAVEGLTPLLVGGGPGGAPLCQLLALTDRNDTIPPPSPAYPMPLAVGMDIYVFGPPNNQVFNAAMNRLQANLPNVPLVAAGAQFAGAQQLPPLPAVQVLPQEVRDHDL